MAEPTLRPCPFCGGDATFGRINDIDDRNHGGNYISCDNPQCEVSTQLRWSLMEDARPLLAETWNTRAADAEIARLRAALIRCVPILEVMDTIRHIDGSFPALDEARAALASSDGEEPTA